MRTLLHFDLDRLPAYRLPWLPSLFGLNTRPFLLLDLMPLYRRARLSYLPFLDLNPLCAYLRRLSYLLILDLNLPFPDLNPLCAYVRRLSYLPFLDLNLHLLDLQQPAQPEPGFLPAEQWGWIQGFHKAMAAVEMETCSRCQERWFEMDLKHNVCHRCFNRDKGNKTPFLMSADNEMDPGELPAHLPELTQVEEMIIARSHVQMLVHRYRGHQYHYSGHCVSFMQNNVKTVDMLPNLPSELDIVVLRPSDQVMESDPRYRSQFRADFRVRRGHVLTWLRYLKANHPDYRYITISSDRMDALPVDSDISSSFVTVVDDTSVEEPVPEQPVSGDLPPPNSQSMIPNLNITATEADLILGEISGRDPAPPGIPAPSIRSTPIDEAAGKDRIFAMAFPTLYPTGRADFNVPRLRKVDLDEYARHMMCFRDGRFGRHPRWRFFVFYYTTEEVRATNAEKLSAMNKPIKVVKARHTGQIAVKATEDEAENLSREFHVCIGARCEGTTQANSTRDRAHKCK